MRKLIIDNIGPIKHVDVDLLRFNVIIGPQSSGKSTIAKVLSTCEWIEKEVATTRDEHAVVDGKEFTSLVESFHKMEGYFDRNKPSYVLFETESILIEYKDKGLKIYLKRKSDYHRQKICYIPAERNMITLPELSSFEFGANSLRSFLYDWYRARAFYSKENKTDILNLGIKYYFDNDELIKKDRIQHVNGETYDISLSNSSSGLQSITPLLVMMQYYTDQYFTEFDRIESFDLNAKTKKTRAALTREVALDLYKPNYSEEEVKLLIAEFNDKLHKGDKRANEIYMLYEQACDRLLIPNKTTFIIEEPEQNLFPFTQVDLIDDIFFLCSGTREHGFTITTHSPFILSYLNVLIMRYYKEDFDKSAVNPQDLAVFSIQDGCLMDLMQTNAKTGMKSVNSEDLVEAMRKMHSDYMLLKQR